MINSQEETNSRLKMRFAGRIVKHLGLQMYSGAVPAIAELIANAWDADATRVEVKIPLGKSFSKRSRVIVKDNGSGMSYTDLNEKYLVIGRDRRAVEGETSETRKRRVMAHKGIGKLAGFGISDVIIVTSVRDGKRSKFRMDYKDIESLHQGETYYPKVVERDIPTQEDDGTVIELSSIKLERAINEDRFKRSMSRRFAILSDEFEVYLNRKKLEKSQMMLELRFPKRNWHEEDIEGRNTRWWIGFTEDPIQYQELRGISIIVRGKLAQKPFYFNLSGGTYGQHGMQYMTGEVVADYLDEEKDLVSSDRMSILWEDPVSAPLIDWGQKKIKELLSEWVSFRRKKNFEKTLEKRPDIAQAIEGYPPVERRELNDALLKVAEIPTIKPKDTEAVFDYVLSGFESRSFMQMIKHVGEMDPQAQGGILSMLQEFDVLEAVKVSQWVYNRVCIIRKFREMINEGVPEKPDMQEYLRKYPWLINPQYLLLQHERSLENVVKDECGIETDEPNGSRRLDFLCVADSKLAVVVEVKRPGLTASEKEMLQIQRYVNFLRNHFAKTNDPSSLRTVVGYLVASDFDSNYEGTREILRRGEIFTVTWSHLLETTERLHKEFLDITIKKASSADPRIIAIKFQRDQMNNS